MGDWPTISLRDAIERGRSISYGIVQPGVDTPDGVPMIRVSDIRKGSLATHSPLRVAADIEQQHSRTRLAGGELLMTIVGTVGETVIAPETVAGWNVARAVAVLPIQSDIGAHWIQLALKVPSVRARIESRLNTTVQATLNLGDLGELPIVLPPIEQRKSIASVLSALEDKIELNRRMNETLEAMVLATYKNWFVDFGPTRAKMAGDVPYYSASIWELFPDAINEHGCPIGWHSGRLGDVAVQVGQSVNPDSLSSDTPYIGLEHMPRRSIALSEWEGAGKVSSGKLSFRCGDVLFGKLRPYFHKVGVAATDGICSTDIVVLNAREVMARSFVLACVAQEDFVAFADRTSEGTKMPRTSWAKMEQYPITVPTSELLHAFERLASPMLARIQANIHERRVLAASRDYLLPKLMSGEVRPWSEESRIGESS